MRCVDGIDFVILKNKKHKWIERKATVENMWIRHKDLISILKLNKRIADDAPIHARMKLIEPSSLIFTFFIACRTPFVVGDWKHFIRGGNKIELRRRRRQKRDD